MKKVWCVILTTILWATGVTAAGTDVDFLLRAMEYSQNTAFRGVLQTTKNNRSAYTVFYQYPLPADKKVLRRMDFLQPGSTDYELKENIDQSNIQNSDGYYIVAGTTAVKQPGRGLNWVASVPAENIAAVSAQNDQRDGIDCRVLTVDFKDMPAGRSPKIARLRYWIGRDRPFIYAWEAFDAQGKSIFLFSFGKVDFSVSLSAKMFMLPVAAKVEVIDDPQKISQKISSSVSIPESFTSRERQWAEELGRAFQKMRGATFYAVEEGRTRDNRKTYRVYYQMVRDNKLWQRKDFIAPDENWDSQKISQSNILNQDGSFICMDQTAVKTEYDKFPHSWIYFVSMKELASVKATPVVYQKVNCTEYLVTLRDKEQPAPAGSDLPKMIKYVVAPPNSLIVSWQSYTREGKLLSALNFERIVDNASLTPETFAIPDGSKIVTAKSEFELKKMVDRVNGRGAQNHNGWMRQGWGKLVGTIEAAGVWLLAYGVYFTVSLAAACLIAIVAIGVYKRKMTR